MEAHKLPNYVKVLMNNNIVKVNGVLQIKYISGLLLQNMEFAELDNMDQAAY